MHDGFMGIVAMTGDMHVVGGAVHGMVRVSESRTAVMVPAAADGVWSQLHHGRGGQRPSVSRQSRRGRGAVRGHALFKLVLQTIHRFSQSQRRPLLLIFKTLLRHCAKWVVTYGN